MRGSIGTLFSKLLSTFLASQLPFVTVITFVLTWDRLGSGETTFMTSWTMFTFIVQKEIMCDTFPSDCSSFISGNLKVLSKGAWVRVVAWATYVTRRTSRTLSRPRFGSTRWTNLNRSLLGLIYLFGSDFCIVW